MNQMLAILFLLGFSGPAFASAQADINQLWKSPSEKRLSSFKKSCQKNDQLDFDGGTVGDLLPLLQKKASVWQVRALIYAEANCTDGASRERLLSALGNEILLQHPAKLVEALHEEKRADLSKVVEQENKDWFAVECESTKCKEERKAYFAKKRKALSGAKVKKALEPMKKDLLGALRSDQ